MSERRPVLNATPTEQSARCDKTESAENAPFLNTAANSSPERQATEESSLLPGDYRSIARDCNRRASTVPGEGPDASAINECCFRSIPRGNPRHRGSSRHQVGRGAMRSEISALLQQRDALKSEHSHQNRIVSAAFPVEPKCDEPADHHAEKCSDRRGIPCREEH